MSFANILLTILGLSVLVIVHESGHYFVARAFGMRVLRFSIGLGPTLFRYQPKNSPTVFQVCAIPFLAYVQIAGMNPHEEVDRNDPSLYPNKGVTARFLTILAGPVANYAAASLLVFGLGIWGWPQLVPTSPMEVGSVGKNTPAEKAGIRAGDQIVRANKRSVKNVEDLIKVTAPRAGKATEYVLRRNGKKKTVTVTPQSQEGRGIIGVVATSKRAYIPMSIGEASKAAFVLPLELTMKQLEGMGELVRKRSTEGLMGPVGMGKLVAEQASHGFAEYVSMLMLLSVALGMFNLLPFPALDGGRLVFLVYELVTRRRPNEKFEAAVHTVGLLFLLGVLVLVTFRDVMG